MAKKTAHYVNYQQRASEFAVGDVVFPFYSDDSYVSGRVVAVYPAIGMVDVEMPMGTKRYPVEEVQKYDGGDIGVPEVGNDNVPGGVGSVPVAGGPVEHGAVRRVSQAFVKKAVYWAKENRQHKATQEEMSSGEFCCPRCKDIVLKKAVYQRQNGASDSLLGCPSCMFLIRRQDLIGHPDYKDPNEDKKPFARLRLSWQKEG